MKGPFRVLVVEDQEDWAERYIEILKPQGYQVEIANCLVDALYIIKKLLFHVAVVDIRLVEQDPHNIDGLEVLRLISELDDGTSKIVSTGHGTIDMSREAFKKYDVSDFIDKRRLDAEEFSAEIQKAALRANAIIMKRKWQESPFKIIGGMNAKGVQETLAAGLNDELRPFLKRLLWGILPCLSLRNPDIGTKNKVETYDRSLSRIHIISWSRMRGGAVEIEFGRRGILKQDKKAIFNLFDPCFPHFCGVIREVLEAEFDNFESPQPKRILSSS